ncbi:hypothetical protein FOYG_17496 [Fusarium oxysporum NRRL 32931]|uniref:Uncharacterized protein n=1 Tax=Fusarium oxysporum NRRL 32931 TaxID=660029 RepID=W9HEB4_FUSOX|nr:hypothetical protein FOYG_17496 [Fusarium oxysporum NRRL 32931]
MTRTCSSRTDSSSSSQHKRQSSLDPAFDFRLNGELTTSPSEIQMAEVAEMKKPSKSPVIYPELDRYRNIQRPSDSSDNRIEVPVRLATHDLPSPIPTSQLLPGTIDTTSTSISSRSHGLVAPLRTHVDPHGLVADRESLTSSSSNSTIRAATIKKKTENLPPLPPSPPPRKSSQ